MSSEERHKAETERAICREGGWKEICGRKLSRIKEKDGTKMKTKEGGWGGGTNKTSKETLLKM
jgi:hypothetical protein